MSEETGFMSDGYNRNDSFVDFRESIKWSTQIINGIKEHISVLWSNDSQGCQMGYLKVRKNWYTKQFDVILCLNLNENNAYAGYFVLASYSDVNTAKDAAHGAYLAWLKDQVAGIRALLDSLI